MATKTVIFHVCDRCHKEQKRPLPHQIKVRVSPKKWTNWDMCADCFEGLGDFLMAGHPNIEDSMEDDA